MTQAEPTEIMRWAVERLRDSPRSVSRDVLAREMNERFGLAKKTALRYLEILAESGQAVPRLGLYWTAENWKRRDAAGTPPTPTAITPPTRTAPVTTTEKSWKCSKDGEAFATFAELEAHAETHPPRVAVGRPAEMPASEVPTREAEAPPIDHPPAARALFRRSARARMSYPYPRTPHIIECPLCGMRRGTTRSSWKKYKGGSRAWEELWRGDGSCPPRGGHPWTKATGPRIPRFRDPDEPNAAAS